MKKKNFGVGSIVLLSLLGVCIAVFVVLFALTSFPKDDDDDSCEVKETINGHELIDLGLSVKWATTNVGASSPEDCGDYFAWGETMTKDTFNADNSVAYGASMSDVSGNAAYDAATANWGDSWRMPTHDEMNELIDNCTWEWTTMNSVKGYLVTGSTGNSIFLPAAGYRFGSSLDYVGESGYYWSSEPQQSDANRAYTPTSAVASAAQTGATASTGNQCALCQNSQ